MYKQLTSADEAVGKVVEAVHSDVILFQDGTYLHISLDYSGVYDSGDRPTIEFGEELPFYEQWQRDMLSDEELAAYKEKVRKEEKAEAAKAAALREKHEREMYVALTKKYGGDPKEVPFRKEQ